MDELAPALRDYHDKVARLEAVNADLNTEVQRLDTKALAWRGVAEQLAARLYVLGEASPALTSYERMKEADSWCPESPDTEVDDA